MLNQNLIPVTQPIERKLRFKGADFETPKMPYCAYGWKKRLKFSFLKKSNP